MYRVITSSNKETFERVAREFWAAIREGVALEPSLEQGWRVQTIFDAVRAADGERRWVRARLVLRMGSR